MGNGYHINLVYPVLSINDGVVNSSIRSIAGSLTCFVVGSFGKMVWSKKRRQRVIAAVLPGLMREQGWEKQLDLHSIFPRWQELVTAEVSDHARPLKIVRGVLWVEVENSAWIQQLQYQKIELLDVLNQALRLTSLTDIKMVLPVGKKETTRGADQSVVFVRPDEEKIAAFEQQVSCITDEKCREALMQFWYLAQACKVKDSK